MRAIDLFDLIGDISDDYIAEAVYKEKRSISMKKIIIISIAAVLCLSCIGWAAKEWIFAPGRGIVASDTLGDTAVYTSEDKMNIQGISIEAVSLLYDPADPESNTLQIWVYRSEDADTARDGRIPDSLRALEVTVEGIPYENGRSRLASEGFSCYSYKPSGEHSTADAPDSISITISDTPLTLQRTGGQDILSYNRHGMSLSLLRLTNELYIGSFFDEELNALPLDLSLMNVMAIFEATFADGTTARASGELMWRGEGSGVEFVSVDTSAYGKEVISVSCVSITADMPTDDTEYTALSLPESDEPVKAGVDLYTVGDFTAVLDEYSQSYSQSYMLYSGEHPLIPKESGGVFTETYIEDGTLYLRPRAIMIGFRIPDDMPAIFKFDH